MFLHSYIKRLQRGSFLEKWVEQLYSKLTVFSCRIQLAGLVHLGILHQRNSIAAPAVSSYQKYHNSRFKIPKYKLPAIRIYHMSHWINSNKSFIVLEFHFLRMILLRMILLQCFKFKFLKFWQCSAFLSSIFILLPCSVGIYCSHYSNVINFH